MIEQKSNTALTDLRHTVLIVAGGGTIIVVGIGIWMVWSWISVVGFVAIGTAILFLICGAANAVIFTAKNLLQETYYDIGEFGTRVKSLFGPATLLPPIAQTTATNAAKVTKTDVQVNIPSLFDLLDIGEIHYGMTDMILGYKEGGQVIRGPWPRTFAVGGKGRSGKTRRVVFMLIQAIMGGAHITICDPHYNKVDSLTRELEPLSPWLNFAGTDEEIVSAANDFLVEMEGRVNTPMVEDHIYQPRLIVFDEWSRLMTRIDEESTEKLKEVVTATSQEYAGFNGYACIIGQSWIAEECGGTKIRRALHSVFVHRIDTDYAKFLIKPRKWYSHSEQLATGHCFYQDLEGKIEKLIMPIVQDKAAHRVAEMLKQIAPSREPEFLPEHASASTSTSPVELKNTIYLPETIMEVPVEATTEAVTDEQFVSVLREIGKKLRAGDQPNDIRKSLGITGGRAMQEVNAALNFLQEHTEMEGTTDGE